jgi:hypothetical protein
MKNLKPLPEARKPFYESYDKLFELRDAVKTDAELYAKMIEIQRQMDEVREKLNAEYIWDSTSAAIENLAAQTNENENNR